MRLLQLCSEYWFRLLFLMLLIIRINFGKNSNKDKEYANSLFWVEGMIKPENTNNSSQALANSNNKSRNMLPKLFNHLIDK